MKSFEQTYLERLQIPHNLINIIRQLGEYKGKQELYIQQAPEMLENLRQVAVIQSTESSNRLEGITADFKRIKELVKGNSKPANRSEAEIAGYRDVLNTIHSNHGHIPFTDNVVLQLHRDLMKYSGKEHGQWKSASNEISEIMPDGRKHIRFVPVAPHLTPDFMRTLHDQYNHAAKSQDVDPLIIISLYILDFLCIHPFLDGNGRMARLLTVILLYQNGYEVARYISLERIIENTKESYYETLYASSRNWHEGNHNALPWIEYLLSTFLAAYREFESRLGKISAGHGSKTDMVSNAIDGFIGEFTISDIENVCPTVGRDWIRTLLQRLKKQGKIEVLGKGRYARWRKIQ
jgi:Fic family protein